MDDDPDPTTLDGYLARLRDGPSEPRASTLREYRARLEKCQRLMGRPLASAGKRDLADLKVELRKQMSGPGTVRVLRRFYSTNGRTDLAERCVLKERVKRLRSDEMLSPGEVKSIIEHAITDRDRALIGVLWDTGARISDVLALRLGDVTRSPSDGPLPLMFRFSFSTKKTDEPVEAWVRDSAAMLDRWTKNHPFRDDPDRPLFCTAAGDAMTERRALQVVKDSARRAELSGRDGRPKRVYSHLFRHSRCTYLLQLGMNETAVKRLLGWSPRSQQIARYSHVASEDAHKSLLRAEGFELPPREKMERLEIRVDEFVPVVPVIPSGVRKPPTVPADVAILLQDPKVQAFVLALGAMRKAAPAT